MGLGAALRSIIRPLSSRRILPLSLPQSVPILSPPLPSFIGGGSGAIKPYHQTVPFNQHLQWGWTSSRFSTSTGGLVLGSLTDIRYPKRRPGFKSRKKRASLKPPGPYAWVQYVPGEPIPESRPNKGSVKGRNRKKRIAQRKAFILSEKKKRKSQYAEFRKQRDIKRIERKMAAVAREKAWAERLIELQQLEAAKKAEAAIA